MQSKTSNVHMRKDYARISNYATAATITSSDTADESMHFVEWGVKLVTKSWMQ